jgi:anti-sigma B factor antagonist
MTRASAGHQRTMPIPQTGAQPAREGGAGLDIITERNGSTVVLTLRGDLDMQTVAQLRRRLAEALERAGGAVIVDLSGVKFIDSTGLAAMLNALRRLTRAGRRLLVACDEGPVLRILRLTRLDTTFALYASRDDALEALAVPIAA